MVFRGAWLDVWQFDGSTKASLTCIVDSVIIKINNNNNNNNIIINKHISESLHVLHIMYRTAQIVG